MSRLIDADELIDEIKTHRMVITGLRYGKGALNEYVKCFVESILKIIDEQPTVGEWIPCSERLPEVEDLHEISIEDCACYLIQRRFGVMDVAHYIKVYGEPYFEAHCMKFKDVIAWKPLPKPYRPERSNT